MNHEKLLKNVIKHEEEIPQLRSQLETKASKSEIGTPLTANSVSEMTDKTKVYVNTTDGNWYSWNGTVWAIGGTYNSQAIGDGSINKNHLNNDISNILYKTNGSLNWRLGSYFIDSGIFVDRVDRITNTFPLPHIKKGSKIKIQSDYKIMVILYDTNIYDDEKGEPPISNSGAVWIENGEYMIPIDGFIRIAMAKKDNSDLTTVLETIDNFINVPLSFKTIRDETNLIEDEIKLIKNDIEASKKNSNWYNKKWYAYGTSMTSIAQGKYVPIVTNLSGLITTNKGIPGGVITGNIKDSVLTCPYDVDLVTLEAGLNDWRTLPIGNLGDKGNDTYYGCLDQCLKYLMLNTRARIVTIGMVTGYKDGEVLRDAYYKTELGNTWRDYCNALKNISNMYGIPYIDVHGECGLGIGRQNISTVIDNIHLTELGGKIVGEYIWSKLRSITPYYTSI